MTSARYKELRRQAEIVLGSSQVFIDEMYLFMKLSGNSGAKEIKAHMESEVKNMLAVATEIFRAKEKGIADNGNYFIGKL